MERLVSNLIFYAPEQGSILERMAAAFREIHRIKELTTNNGTSNAANSGYFNETDAIRTIVNTQIRRLTELASKYRLNGNLWHYYISFYIIMNENPFSLGRERNESAEASADTFAREDLKILRQLFCYDFSEIHEFLGNKCFQGVADYVTIEKPEHMYNKNIGDKVALLTKALEAAGDDESFYKEVTNFYKKTGVAHFALNKAFRISESDGEKVCLNPISNMAEVLLQDLIGYDEQKEKLLANTRAFVEGKRANNVLLYGDSGTGKSTSIKAIVNEFYDDGLRMIEIYKHQFKLLSQVISQIKNRNYKFIIYMDDLSFEEDEVDYKFLKALIEGGVETRPDNILIYATSNRRHLIKETWNDRRDVEQDGDIHRSDTMEEKLSLASRFGVSIGYYKPSRVNYHEIVLGLAQRYGIEIDKEELLAEADRWEMRHGGTSGRTAQQFINDILGKRE